MIEADIQKMKDLDKSTIRDLRRISWQELSLEEKQQIRTHNTALSLERIDIKIEKMDKRIKELENSVSAVLLAS